MAPPAFRCDGCNAPVEDRDLETGSAITLLGKTYCPSCKAGATKSVTLKDLVAQTPPPPQAPRPEEAPTVLSSLPRRRVSLATGGSKKPWIVVAILFAAALAAAAALKAAGAKEPPKPEPPPPLAAPPVAAESPALTAARKAFQAAEVLAQRPDVPPAELLAALEKARAACRDTSYETPLETLRNAALQRKEADEALKELAPLLAELAKAVADDKAFARYGELQPRFDRARGLAARAEGARIAEIQALQSEYGARYEKAAQPFFEEIHEAAQALAGERRYDDALRYIDTFPAHLRHSGVWKTLDRLREDIERRRAQKR